MSSAANEFADGSWLMVTYSLLWPDCCVNPANSSWRIFKHSLPKAGLLRESRQRQLADG